MLSLKKLNIDELAKIDIIETKKSSLIDELTKIYEKVDNKNIGINKPKANDKTGLLEASLSLNAENNQKIGIIKEEKPRTNSLFLLKNQGSTIAFHTEDNSKTLIWRLKTKNIKNPKMIHK